MLNLLLIKLKNDMKIFLTDKEVKSPIVEASCSVVENKLPAIMHTIDDINFDVFIKECEKEGISYKNVSVYAALHLISY